jgi:hypothetical protein
VRTWQRWTSSLILGTCLFGLLPALSAGAALPVTRTAASPGTTTAVQAVAALLAAFTKPSVSHACDAVRGAVDACPITPRLRYYLQHPPRTAGGGANLVCRCQNPPRFIHWQQRDNNGYQAHVTTLWTYGAGAKPNITFVVARQAPGWSVDDTYCAGRPETSLFVIPAGPC